MRKWILLLLLTLPAGIWFSGCGPERTQPQPSPEQTEEMAENNEVTLILYYGDREAMGLLSEERVITVPPEKHLIQAALEELGKEPSQVNAIVMLPPETEILDITVADGIITINFNAALSANFYGGSTSEALLVDSIVNTVTGIDEYSGHGVQFLIDGETIDSIGGHLGAENPFYRHN